MTKMRIAAASILMVMTVGRRGGADGFWAPPPPPLLLRRPPATTNGGGAAAASGIRRRGRRPPPRLPSSLAQPPQSRVGTLRLESTPPSQREDDGGPAAPTGTCTTAMATSPVLAEAERLRGEAERIRLEAEQLEAALTLRKVTSLEAKLGSRGWLERHPETAGELRDQLRRLNDRLDVINDDASGSRVGGSTFGPTTGPKWEAPAGSGASTGTGPDTSDAAAGGKAPPPPQSSSSLSSSDLDGSMRLKGAQTPTPASSSASAATGTGDTKRSTKSFVPPVAGFDEADLELYIPIANDIQRMAPNSTVEERVELFRAAPELQQHFAGKIQRMLAGPLEDLQTLEVLRQQFLDSTSGRERDGLKRRIDRIEASLAGDGDDGPCPGPTGYGRSIQCRPDELPHLSEEGLNERIRAVGSLPDILIAIYKQRNGVGAAATGRDQGDPHQAVEMDDGEELKLAILMDYYERQLQLLEEARSIDPLTDDVKLEFVSAYESLPMEVRRKFVSNLGIEEPDLCTPDQVLEEVLTRESPVSPLLQVVEAGNAISDPPGYGYNDIEFVDRSRFLEDFFPAIAKMEGSHPSQEAVDQFVADCLDRKTFMVTSKPERVVGGYYIRGENLVSDNEDLGITAADNLVDHVARRLAKNPSLDDQIEFFYILDPSPPTDEEIAFGSEINPIFLVATKNQNMMYQVASPLTKSLVSLTGVTSALLFSVGSCALNPAIATRVYKSLDAATNASTPDIQWFLDLFFPLYFALGGILLAHELGHRIVASSNKFEIGLPSIIPSLTTGVTGSITPIKSPPPNSKALFDFAIAGPLAGLAISVTLLVTGLKLTQTLSLNTQLPVLPVDFVRSSSLGGGLVQYFLGNMAVLPDQGPNAVVELHPFAIAGFIGCVINALSMLPLGHTDGGRISLAMFGRRGAFVTKLFTMVILATAGLFGLDDANVLVAYGLFTLIWQRELETPARNEVDELDISRGMIGIASSIVVGLILIPML